MNRQRKRFPGKDLLRVCLKAGHHNARLGAGSLLSVAADNAAARLADGLYIHRKLRRLFTADARLCVGYVKL